MPPAQRLIFRVELSLPHLPAELEGLRIAHVSDLHIQRPRRRYERIAEALDAETVDLVFLTGDYMSFAEDAPAAGRVLHEMVPRLRARARLGIFGVWGNHDTPALRATCGDLPVRWLDNQCVRPHPMLELSGLENDRVTDPDAVAAALAMAGCEADSPALPERAATSNPRPLRLMLCHLPTYLPVAADMGVDVLFSGHTHGGQCRLPGAIALKNSTDLPLRLTAGVLRLGDTLCVVSRGLGEVWLPLRVFCPPHLPIYTLRRGPLPGAYTAHIVNVWPW